MIYIEGISTFRQIIFIIVQNIILNLVSIITTLFIISCHFSNLILLLVLSESLNQLEPALNYRNYLYITKLKMVNYTQHIIKSMHSSSCQKASVILASSIKSMHSSSCQKASVILVAS